MLWLNSYHRDVLLDGGCYGSISITELFYLMVDIMAQFVSPRCFTLWWMLWLNSYHRDVLLDGECYGSIRITEMFYLMVDVMAQFVSPRCFT